MLIEHLVLIYQTCLYSFDTHLIILMLCNYVTRLLLNIIPVHDILSRVNSEGKRVSNVLYVTRYEKRDHLGYFFIIAEICERLSIYFLFFGLLENVDLAS